MERASLPLLLSSTGLTHWQQGCKPCSKERPRHSHAMTCQPAAVPHCAAKLRIGLAFVMGLCYLSHGPPSTGTRLTGPQHNKGGEVCSPCPAYKHIADIRRPDFRLVVSFQGNVDNNALSSTVRARHRLRRLLRTCSTIYTQGVAVHSGCSVFLEALAVHLTDFDFNTHDS